jgi:hypothetical protein
MWIVRKSCITLTFLLRLSSQVRLVGPALKNRPGDKKDSLIALSFCSPPYLTPLHVRG